MTAPTTKLTEHGLFSSRETLEEALKYGEELIASRVSAEDRMAAFTAMFVVSNTAIRLLAKAQMQETIPYTEAEYVSLCQSNASTHGEPGWKVTDLTRDEAQKMLRTKLPEMTTLAFALRKAGYPLATPIGSYLMLLAAAFGMDEDDVAEEVVAYTTSQG